MCKTLPLVVATLLFTMAVPRVIAAPSQQLNFGTEISAGECDTDNATLIINVIQRVTGDLDIGAGGNYWAYDEYDRHIQVWQLDVTTFCALVRYTGSFTTVAGTSPGGTNTVAADVTGTMEGGFRATITGTLKATPLWTTHGSVGSFDFGCDAATGACPGRVNWIPQYFDRPIGFAYSWWGWVYHAGNNGSWLNSIPSSGDITGTP